MICLDTHALLWWALDPDQLSDRAAEVVAEMEIHGGVASAISIWELGLKAKRGKLELGIGIGELTRRIEKTAIVELVPVDATVWIRSLELTWSHRDAADRVIVATALLAGVPLLTKDTVMQAFGGITTIW